jgi:hypothetical protein
VLQRLLDAVGAPGTLTHSEAAARVAR